MTDKCLTTLQETRLLITRNYMSQHCFFERKKAAKNIQKPEQLKTYKSQIKNRKLGNLEYLGSILFRNLTQIVFLKNKCMEAS